VEHVSIAADDRGEFAEERCVDDFVAVLHGPSDRFAALRIPKAGGAIKGNAGEETSIGAVKGEGDRGIVMIGKKAHPRIRFPHARGASASGGGGFDVLRALKVTTHAIRSVRNYLLSLPDEQGISRSQPRQDFRPSSLSTSEP